MRLPRGVRTVVWATAIRWFGWGLVEALLPIFMFRFTGNFFETALITGAFYLFFILTLPFAGVLADRINARTLLMTSLFLYLFIGVGYVLAGITGVIWCVILARMLNGSAYAIDVVSRFTYYRRHTDKEYSGRVFGYALALGNTFWLVAMLISLLLVNSVPLHFLFAGISATALIAFVYVYLRLPQENDERALKAVHVFAGYKNMWEQVQHHRASLRTLMFFSFTLGFLTIVTSFFIPLYVYAHDDNLQHVVLITGVIVLPTIFGRYLGAIVDKLHVRVALFAFLLLIPLMIALPFASYYLQLVLAFCISAILQLLALTQQTIVTHLVHPSRYGRVESVLQVVATVGTIAGSLAMGAVSQWAGQDNAFWFLAVALVLPLLLFYKRRKHLMHEHAEL